MSNETIQKRVSDRLRAYIIMILIILMLVFAVGAVVMVFLYQGQRDQSDFMSAAYKKTKGQLTGLSKQLEIKTNKLGQEKAKTVVLETNNKELHEILKADNSEDRAFMMRTLKEFGIKIKDIKNVTNLKVESSGQFIAVTRDSITETIRKGLRGYPLDTVKSTVKVFHYRDTLGWFDMNGVITADSIRVTPTFYNDFDVAIHSEKIPKRYFLDLFPPKHTVAEVVNRNPYTKTKDLRTIVRKPRQKFLGIF
jgi:flagellar basal body-associated protein FliL